MKLLIDTHVLFWWLTDDPKLSKTASEFISNPDNLIHVSAASIWEISIKVKLGKWPEVRTLLQDHQEILKKEGFEPLPITLAHARHAGLLDWDHRDPFDRMLLAQAELEQMHLISTDVAFKAAPLRVLW